MIRVRQKGVVVPRHNVGMQRAVRGDLRVADEWVPEIGRHCRTAIFKVDDLSMAEAPKLFDAALVHVSDEMMVLSGFEHELTHGLMPVDYAQTWVLRHLEDDGPQGSMGAPYPR